VYQHTHTHMHCGNSTSPLGLQEVVNLVHNLMKNLKNNMLCPLFTSREE